MADGPVIQAAMQRALQKKINMNDILILIKRLRKVTTIPCVIFSYLNPILQQPSFYQEAADAGADGVLIVDLPLEEAQYHQQQCLTYHLAPIYLITPSTSLARIQQITQYARGFIYYACQKGTTGVRNNLPQNLGHRIQTIKTVTDIPVVVGFGVNNKSSAQKICTIADGVVVGSHFVAGCEQRLSRAEMANRAKMVNPRTIHENKF
jgi:tryptophan synthase alpha chain